MWTVVIADNDRIHVVGRRRLTGPAPPECGPARGTDELSTVVERLVRRAGGRFRHLAVVTPTPAPIRWQHMAERRRAALVSRPYVLAMGLGLAPDTGAGSLVVEVGSGGVVVSLLADGAVAISQSSHDVATGTIAAVVRSVLRQADPDTEWDVAETGVHLVGDLTSRVDLASRLGLPVSAADDTIGAIVAGVTLCFEGQPGLSGSGRRSSGPLRLSPSRL